ncbi:hypothetical protein [Niabella hibiscisoli]|uniref:hypothetical protein n=1 Tax=Niabella hibiscisoli TaxID=1825928 RepID=UPI001F0F1919|nr:hypothetical protein [Niabella hibiscisoli]MCH5714921.1 hypothetical protein [Niabella hibiscisoli]
MVIRKWLPAILLLCTVGFLAMTKRTLGPVADSLEGAWSLSYGGQDFAMLFEDGYCMFTQYNLKEKKFGLTAGGPFTTEGGKIRIKTEFNSANKLEVGKMQEYGYKLSGNELTTTLEGFELKWKRVDTGEKHLAGNWRIVKRKQGEEISDIPLRPRRTLKLLTATRFQWAAINVETGEFSGTGAVLILLRMVSIRNRLSFFPGIVHG